MSVLGYLAQMFRGGRDVWYGPELVDEVRADGDASDNAVPTEAAVRSAVDDGGGGTSTRWKRWLDT